MAGYTYLSLDGQTFSGGTDAFLTKYDANGNKAWTRLLGTSSNDYAYALTTGTDGAIYMAGTTYLSLDMQTFSGGADAFLTKYDANGSKAWTRQLGTSSSDQAHALTTGTDGAIYMAGYTGGSLDGQTSSGYDDAFLTKWSVNAALPTLQFAPSSGSAPEGNSGTSTITVQAALSAASTQTVTVPISYSGSATQGTDYMIVSTSITIAEGQITGSASFSVVGDTIVESDETVVLTMGTPTNATLGANKVYTHTILNDDVDTTPPTIAITCNKSALKAGETATITFTLSEPASDFAQSDVTVTGGTLSGFTGSGTNYTAIFTPSANSTANGVVSVASDKFSDAAGNFNKDGADANNTVTITRELNATRTHALTVLVDKGVLGAGPVLLKDLVEEITTTGTTVTSHTVTYGTAKFTYSDVDALITTVIRDGEFTEEFRKEIADQYPSFGSITYKDAVSLIGARAIDGILISVAGADGNFVG